MIEGDTVVENPILRLSHTGKSLIVMKDGRKWIQAIAEIEPLFRDVSVGLCAMQPKKRKNKPFFDCERAITLTKDRARLRTTIDGRRYLGLMHDLQKLIESRIGGLEMAESAKKSVKIRKIEGMAIL
jgi:hypothetical protein